MKRNRLLCLLIFIIGIFSVGVIGVKAGCTNCDAQDWEQSTDDSGTIGGGGACIRNSLCGNSNFITIKVDFAHLKAHQPSNVLASIQFTNNPSLANGTTIIYEPSLTKEKYAYGVATEQIEKMFYANNGALAKQYLQQLGVTDFSGIHGSDAFGAVFQPMVQYKGADGQMHMTTMKEYASIATNKARILDFLSRVATGTDDVLQYVQGMTPAQCKAAGLAVAASAGTGCGMAILDLACLLGIIPEPIPPKTCPGGDMVKNGSFGDCEVSESKDGQSFGFSYTPTGGSKTNVHRALGEETKPVGKYCSLYCQEFGTAILPGATGEALTLGSYIIWPTSKSNHDASKFKKGFYPLKFTGQLYCKMGIEPDPNLPGANGACFEDPSETYRVNYEFLAATWNQQDHSTKRYEEVRYDWTKLDPGMCISNYDVADGNTSCQKAISKKMYIYGLVVSPIAPCTSKLEEALPKEEKNLVILEKDLQQKEKILQEEQEKLNGMTPNCQSCHYVCSGAYGPCHDECSDPCAGPYKAQKAKVETAKANRDAAKALVEKEKNIIQQIKQKINIIKDNIRTCQKYTEAFRVNREIVHEYHVCDANGYIGEDDYDFSSSATLSWSDEEYFNIGNVKVESSTKNAQNPAKIGIVDGYTFMRWEQMAAYLPTSLVNDINRLKANEYVVTAEDKYTLSTGYKFIDKKTLKYKKSKSGLKNYLDITKSIPTIESVLPTSYDNVVGKNYKLILKSISFGQAGFSSSKDYVCKQDFTKTNDSCKCPSGYKYAGRDLSGLIKNNHKTCGDLLADEKTMKKYCDEPCTEEECPEDGFYCDPPYAYISLDSCVNSGKTLNECKKIYCTKPKNRNYCMYGGAKHYLDTLEPENEQPGECRADESQDECEARLCPKVDVLCKDCYDVVHTKIECGNKESTDDCIARVCPPCEPPNKDSCTNKFTKVTYYKKYLDKYRDNGLCKKSDSWEKCKKKVCPDKALCYYNGEWHYEYECKSGESKKDCKNRLCYIGEPPACEGDCDKTYKCKNSNNVGGYMDITACVQTKKTQGKTTQEAIDECDSVMCPLGKFIIYRTIKMENPFPGKEISKVVDGFNNEVKGRYPGYNWNSKTLVSSKIRNNRDTNGTTLYQEKEPLYSFELDGVTIEALRNYNKEQKEGYNDFTLDCRKNNMYACISKVVHNAHLSGLVGGTCQNIGLDNGFYECAK